MLRCIRKHLIVTVIYYAVVIAGLRFISTTTQVSLNYLLLLTAFVGELMITLIVSRNIQFQKATKELEKHLPLNTSAILQDYTSCHNLLHIP